MRRFGFLLVTLSVAAPALADAQPVDFAAAVTGSMDLKADPCQDFYQYACGTWRATTQLPADEVRWSRSFQVIGQRNRVVNRSILENAARSPGDDPNRQKLGWFYGTCMDEAGIEAAGTKPIAGWMKDVRKVKDAAGLMATVGRMHAANISALFDIGVEGDYKNPDTDIGQFFQGGLNLPDRDYYLSEDEGKKTIRDQYLVFVATMFEMYGEKPEAAKAMAGRVLAFETELAKNSRPRAELRDPDKTYNKLDRAGLQKLTPKLDWDGYFKAMGHPEITQLNIATPEFFSGLEKLAYASDAATLQAYLKWAVLRNAAPSLPKRFDEANFNFYGKTLRGQKEQQPRWKRCVAQTDGALGDLLGQEFIKQQFAGDSKKIARELIETIQTAFAGNLPDLAWMDDTTRERALGKKAAITNKIGYPDKWRDYSKLEIKNGKYFGNRVAAERFEFERQAAKIGKPRDKSEWGMTPPAVNAYYNPLNNEMAFPAGILQPPFFSKDFPAAMNYGGIGMAMGHELTHGFDDQGRKFDAQGKLTEWWEPSVATKFEERAACIEKQYSNYEVQPGVNVNGKLTLGENIADNGGIKQAYDAYKAYEAAHPGTEKPAVPGLTNDQLVFVAFAQTWCSIATPEIEREFVTTDPHSPPRFRVLGPLSNYDQFATTFQCGEGTPMHPKDRCEVW